ncbi:MAG: glutaredoxin domain-containing protein [Veillonella parvula]|nr:glutaredoxin domain-containing protein [Veillonella parvula]
MLFVEYPKCTTCKKAKKFLDDHKIKYTDRDIKSENPTAEEIAAWYPQSNGMLVKRPILVLEDKVLVGFKEAEWVEALKL